MTPNDPFTISLGPVSAKPEPERGRRQPVTDTTLCTVGIHKGTQWRDVPDDYCRWLMQSGKDGPVGDYLEKRFRVYRPPYIDPYKRHYYTVLADEPVHPLWMQVHTQPKLTLNIPC